MDKIIFKIKDSTKTEDIAATIHAVGALKGIFNTEALFPGDPDRRMGKIFVATADGSVSTDQLVDTITKIDNIQYAEKPPKRHLI